MEQLGMSVSKGTTITVETLPSCTSTQQYILSKVDADGREDKDDPFYVCDLGRVIELYDEWTAAMPGIQPFYAVKCNSDPALFHTLASLGAGFDCASKNELKAVLDLGVPADRIIYAHPCKQVSHLQFAAAKDVKLMTFDIEQELYKVKAHFPTARLVLRIKADDPQSRWSFGAKFGCSVSVGKDLLTTATQLGLSVVGVSFHVGSYAQSGHAFADAIEMAAEMFRHAEDVGHNMTLLDIGGGFPGQQEPEDYELFKDLSVSVNQAIADYFSGYKNVKIIAEPGRYLVTSTSTVVLNVIGKEVTSKPDQKTSMAYYANEGIYGTLRFFQKCPRVLEVLKPPSSSVMLYPSKIWGQTCDSADLISESVMLPELAIGDWLFAEGMGDYTISVGSTFNGFALPIIYYYVTDLNRARLGQLCGTKMTFLFHEVDEGDNGGHTSNATELVTSNSCH